MRQKKIVVHGCFLLLLLSLVGGGLIPKSMANGTSIPGQNEVSTTGNGASSLVVNYRDGVLLIPDSSNDTVGMFHPYNGTYLGNLLAVPLIHGTSGTAVNAIPGPDGNIYVSDQLQDTVFVFTSTGTFLYEYANGTDGLNNIRGISFRGTHLFVTSGDDYVAEFDGPHSRLTDFINDGSDPFDIFFLTDGRALLSDIEGSTDNVRLYHANGTLDTELFPINFPQQIMTDPVSPGAYLNAGFSANLITDFDLTGTIVQTTPLSGARGIYRLGNGNLLATSSAGVLEIQPGTGAIIENKKGGSHHFIEFQGPPQQAYTLTIIIQGEGSVVKDPDQATYPYGTLVELTAVPDPGWAFSHWTGDLTGTTNPTTISMTGNKTVTAHFTPLTSSVTLGLSPGWNLITVPVETTWTAESLGDNLTGCSVVLMFNATTQTFLTHVVNTPWDDFPLQDGVGYFIYVTSGSTFEVTGYPITGVTVPISPGWNIIGWYKVANTTAESLGDNITGCSTVLMFDAVTQTFLTHVVNTPWDNFVVTRGMGLFLYTTSASDWHGEG